MQESVQWSEEQKYQDIFLNHPMPMWIFDYETKAFVAVNEEAIRHYGYSRDEFLSMTINDIRPFADVSKLSSIERTETQYSSIYEGAWRHYKKNGELIYVEITSHLIEYKGRKAALVLINDVTGKVKIEELKEFERRDKEALINNTEDMFWSVSRTLKLMAANHSFTKNVRELLGVVMKPGDSVMPEDFPQEFREYWENIYRRALNGECYEQEIFTEGNAFKKGEWLEIRFNPINKNSEIVGVACYARNITERKKNEEALRESNERYILSKKQQQHEITEAVISAQEKERQEIGRELHDNINQILATARLYLGVAKDDPGSDPSFIKKADEFISNAITEIRNLSHALIPPTLGKTKLSEAITLVLDTMGSAGGFTVHKKYSGIKEGVIDNKLKLSIYRIVQEQLNNIYKYSRAKNVWVELAQSDGKLKLTIKDDGVGFDQSKKQGGVGFMNMRTRAALFKGKIKVVAAEGEGCAVTAVFPVVAQ